MKLWNRMYKKREWKFLRNCIEKNQSQGLILLAKTTNDMGMIHEILGYLYDTKDWHSLDSLYLETSCNQYMIRDYLKNLYKKSCFQLQQEMSAPIKEEKRIMYAAQLDMMVGHTLCTKEETPTYGNLLTDLFIQVANASSLVNRTSLILANYPEKQNAIKNALIQRGQLEYLYYFIKISSLDVEYIDISFVSYVFHQIETLYEDKDTISYEKIMDMYQYLQNFVLKYNEQKVRDFEKVLSSTALTISEMIQEVSNPENPILAMLTLLPISEIECENIILAADCNQRLKQDMLMAFRNRNQNIEQLKQMDLCYVLNNNSIQRKIQAQQSQTTLSKEKEVQKMKS